jgi:hypothetical protein
MVVTLCGIVSLYMRPVNQYTHQSRSMATVNPVVERPRQLEQMIVRIRMDQVDAIAMPDAPPWNAC